MSTRISPIQAAIALLIAAFLFMFLVIPVITVVYVAFSNPGGGFTLAHFGSFFSLSLMRESFWNSLYVGGMSVLIASIIALPLAYFTVRFQFRGAILIQTLGVLPLIMPPFVGATAMQLIFGRNGSASPHRQCDITKMYLAAPEQHRSTTQQLITCSSTCGEQRR
jgi:iron(III) transport system permease protein